MSKQNIEELLQEELKRLVKPNYEITSETENWEITTNTNNNSRSIVIPKSITYITNRNIIVNK